MPLRRWAFVLLSNLGFPLWPAWSLDTLIYTFPFEHQLQYLGLSLENATVLHNLAELYKEQGKYSEAEPFFKRALIKRKKDYGPKDPLVAQSLDGLAEVYRAQERYAEAEDLYKQISAIELKASGTTTGFPVVPVILIVLLALIGLGLLSRAVISYDIEKRGGV
jgi:tetratricopeptide (TPR) repeat protein